MWKAYFYHVQTSAKQTYQFDTDTDIALCFYPNVKWGIWVRLPPLAPFCCNSIISEKIFGLQFGCSFTFLIVVGRLESVHHNRIINTIHSVYFMKLLRTMAEHKHVRTSWTPASEQNEIFWEDEKTSKYSYISNFIFTMMGAPEEEVILRCFFQNEVNCLCAKFEVPPIPPTGFLPINATYFTNVWWAYFSLNICTVVHQSELEWSDLDQN